MKLKLIALLVFFTTLNINAQETEDYQERHKKFEIFKKKFEGDYYELTAPSTYFKVRLSDLGLMYLLSADSSSNMAFYYMNNESKKIKKWVFFEKRKQILTVQYDEDSFVMILPTEGAAYANFFTKTKSKLRTMSQEKAKEYALNAIRNF